MEYRVPGIKGKRVILGREIRMWKAGRHKKKQNMAKTQGSHGTCSYTGSTPLALLCMVDFIWIQSYFYPMRTFRVGMLRTQSWNIIAF